VREKEIEDTVFLTQTDTTIGFVSQNADKLTAIKKRPPHKHYIKAIPSLEKLKSLTRVPNIHKKKVRRAKKTTFVFPNGHSYRIIRDEHHQKLIHKLGWAYTTSANLTNKPYDEEFAIKNADIVIYPLKNTDNHIASKIYKINNYSIKKIR